MFFKEEGGNTLGLRDHVTLDGRSWLLSTSCTTARISVVGLRRHVHPGCALCFPIFSSKFLALQTLLVSREGAVRTRLATLGIDEKAGTDPPQPGGLRIAP